MAKAIILTGVSGSGKSSIGQSLSARLGWSFYDGDDFHTPQSVEKMSHGIPLSDEDRFPWLDTLNKLIIEKTTAGEDMILACSALKRSYRQRLRRGIKHLNYIYLDGDYDLIWNRMQDRGDHYMKSAMLQSQFEVLEIPRDALKVDIDRSAGEIIQEIIEFIQRLD